MCCRIEAEEGSSYNLQRSLKGNGICFLKSKTGKEKKKKNFQNAEAEAVPLVLSSTAEGLQIPVISLFCHHSTKFIKPWLGAKQSQERITMNVWVDL